MEETQSKLVGQSLYFELVSKQDTKSISQIIITPSVILDGKRVPNAMIRRSVSQWSPRAQWQITQISTKVSDTKLFGTEREFVKTMSSDDKNSLVLETLSPIQKQLAYLLEKEWMLRDGKFITVETSEQDVIDINQYNTPQGLIRRIMRTRKDAGFPETLVAE